MLSYSRQIAIVCKDRSYDKENAQVRCKKMEPIAKEATRDALKTYIWPSDRDEDLTLGIRLEDEYGIFELYFSGERPEDAIVLTEAHVNRITGEVSVKVFLPKKPEADGPSGQTNGRLSDRKYSHRVRTSVGYKCLLMMMLNKSLRQS